MDATPDDITWGKLGLRCASARQRSSVGGRRHIPPPRQILRRPRASLGGAAGEGAAATHRRHRQAAQATCRGQPGHLRRRGRRVRRQGHRCRCQVLHPQLRRQDQRARAPLHHRLQQRLDEPPQARAEAKRLRHLVDQGGDPLGDIEAEREAPDGGRADATASRPSTCRGCARAARPTTSACSRGHIRTGAQAPQGGRRRLRGHRAAASPDHRRRASAPGQPRRRGGE